MQKLEGAALQILRTRCTSLVYAEKFQYSRGGGMGPAADHPGQGHLPFLEKCRLKEEGRLVRQHDSHEHLYRHKETCSRRSVTSSSWGSESLLRGQQDKEANNL